MFKDHLEEKNFYYMLIIALVYIKINDFCGIILFKETREINVLYYEV